MAGNRVNLMRGPPRNDAIRGSNGRWTIPGRLLYDNRTSEGGAKGRGTWPQGGQAVAKHLNYGTYYINIGKGPRGLKKKSGKISRRKRCGFNFISYFWRVPKRAGQHEYN